MAYRDTILAISGLQSFWELEEAAGATSVADSKGTVTGTPGTTTTAPTFGQPGLLAEGGLSCEFVAANLQFIDFGTSALTLADGPGSYIDPNADGASTAWTKSTGTAAWSLLNDAVRQPTAPTVPGGNISTSTSGALQDVAFPDTLVWAAGQHYALWVYANTAAATKKKIQAAVSTNDGTSFATAVDLVPAAGATGWYGLDVSGSITSQATLNGLRVRFSMTTTGGGSSGTVTIYAAYVEQTTHSPFTIEAWVKPNSFPAADQVFLNKFGGSYPTISGYIFGIGNAAGNLRFTQGDGAGQTQVASATALTAGSVYHLVVTNDGANISLYINGVLDTGPTAVTKGIAGNTAANLRMGLYSGGGGPLDGWLDAVAVYNRALTATEVATNHTAGTTAAAAKSLVYDERRVRRNSLLRR